MRRLILTHYTIGQTSSPEDMQLTGEFATLERAVDFMNNEMKRYRKHRYREMEVRDDYVMLAKGRKRCVIVIEREQVTTN